VASAPANTHKKWDWLLAATLLENQSNYLKQLNVEESKQNVAAFTKFAFPLIRKVYPKLITNNVVSVQPMTGAIGGVGLYKDEEPLFVINVGVRSLFKRKLADGSARKIIGIIIKIGQTKDDTQQPFAVVEDALSGDQFKFYFYEIEKVSLLEVVAAAAS